ncbi:hypothetical protein L195_g046775, partial [Trifolium pratense]
MDSSSQKEKNVEEETNEVNVSHDEEESVIVFDDDDVEEGLTECRNSVIAKIITDKPIHKGSLQSALASIWCNPKEFRMEEVEEKMYQLFFGSDKDLKRVINGS